jgi:hypothetical protein
MQASKQSNDDDSVLPCHQPATKQAGAHRLHRLRRAPPVPCNPFEKNTCSLYKTHAAAHTACCTKHGWILCNIHGSDGMFETQQGCSRTPTSLCLLWHLHSRARQGHS